jgi:hypothetical protein
MDKFDAWLDGIDDKADEFAYRYVYAAYQWACHGGDDAPYGLTLESLPGGGHVLRYGDGPELELADERERLAFAAHIVARFCGTRYPNMAAWEDQQHRWYVEDLDW